MKYLYLREIAFCSLIIFGGILVLTQVAAEELKPYTVRAQGQVYRLDEKPGEDTWRGTPFIVFSYQGGSVRIVGHYLLETE